MTPKHMDFNAVRAATRFETVLAHYGLKVSGRGPEAMVCCPFHDDRSPSCSVNFDKKIFHCFACGEKGTVLDFVAGMESCSIADAAKLLADWYGSPVAEQTPAHKSRARPDQEGGNEPLGFALPLDPSHPYLAERGLSHETITRFGLGYCDRGVMRGRICIPIHDHRGRLVAYAGRWPDRNLPPGEPRYRFPLGFRKRHVLFNYHRVAGAAHLVIVEGFWSVFRLDALGIAAVALMGCTLSEDQEDIIGSSLADRVTLLLDGDASGRNATPKILARLARHRFVHAPYIPEGAEPDAMDEAALLAAIKPAA